MKELKMNLAQINIQHKPISSKNKIMKTKLLFAALYLQFFAQAQFSAGAKLDFSMGNISSQNLQKNLDYQRNMDVHITQWDVTRKWGLGFGVGGFVTYNITDRFSLLLEPTINFLSCGLNFKRVDNYLNNNGDGTITTQTTTSDMSLIYVSLPLMARYSLTKNNFFIEAGLGVNFTGVPNITSTENSQTDHYNGGNLTGTTVDNSYSVKTKLNVFSSPRGSFIFGLGKSFDLGGRALAIDIRYSLPLTKSEMFTTDASYNSGIFGANNLLGINGKEDAERNAPYLLNDFKMSTITLSVAYTIFRRVSVAQ